MKLKQFFVSLSVAALVALGITGLSGTPANVAPPKAHASYLNNCYTTMFGETWCYRMGCTTLEVWFNGCYDGWVRVNRPWYA